MKKILVSGYFAKNFGDDLFFKILFDRYKNENIKWIVDTGYKEYSKIFEEYSNVTIRNKIHHKIINKLNLREINYKSLDAAVFIGGSIFMEHDNWKSKYLYKKKLFDKIGKQNVFFVGCNFGPYKSTEFFEKNKSLFEKSMDICFRDTYSYGLFSDLSNVRLAADIVFGLKTQKVDKKKNTLGISVIDLKGRGELEDHKDSYIEKMTEIVVEAIDKNIDVTLFSFCEDQGDLDTCNEIYNRLDSEYVSKVRIVNYDGNIEGFLRAFSSMENIIGTRFHACVLSQVFDQGLYPVIYSNKTYNMLSDIDLIDLYTYVKDVDQIDSSFVINNISENKLTNDGPFLEGEKHFEVLDGYIKE